MNFRLLMRLTLNSTDDEIEVSFCIFSHHATIIIVVCTYNRVWGYSYLLFMYTTINQLVVSLNILPTRTMNFNIAVCLPRNSTLFKSESN